VDAALVARAGFFEHARIELTPQGRIEVPPIDPGQRVTYIQVRTSDGRTITGANSGDIVFQIPPEASHGPVFTDERIGGVHFRTYSEPVGDAVLTLALPLTDVDQALKRLALILLLLTAGGVALAVALGGGVTAAAAAPVARLTEAAEAVRETGDLSLRIEEPASREDELGRLAASFNAMLGALEVSVNSQRRLVADASHELRTPITSIRTNIDLLASGRPLADGDREQILRDVADQLEELTTIVNDLVELARDGEPELVATEVRLDDVVRDAVQRAERHARHVRYVVDAAPSVVVGDPGRLSRAVVNLLDNAAKWSPIGAEIDVTVRDGVVTVRDHGSGFATEDLPHVFDRFYRSAAARGTPGSGLGLAIVRQVAESHGGRVTAENAEGGGAIVRFEVPTAEPATEPGDRTAVDASVDEAPPAETSVG
jgi:two-component system, OmpR family, sensor histidine kinase MprB